MTLKLHKFTFLVLLSWFLSLFTCAQDIFKPKFNLEVQVLLYKTQNLIDLQAIVQKDHDGTINELSFYDFLHYMKDGKKVSYFESQIEHLEFIDFDGKKRVFISSRYTDIKNARGLWEILCAGKITWYREYFPVFINGARTTGSRDFFVKEGEKPVSGARRKKKLLLLTSDQPGLMSKIKSLKSDDDILEILRIYNGKANPV